MSALRCPAQVVDATIRSLQEAGQSRTERVVLWLAKRPLVPGSAIEVAYVPEQKAAIDYFRIPPASMSALMSHLRANRLALAAQVHSHPHRAFHSQADDKWAIVRHEGALSLVVPYFAAGVTAENFADAIAAYRLSADDRWLEIGRADLPSYFEVV
jgi:hypothetical protein